MLQLLKRSSQPKAAGHEEVFTQRYEQLHSWAMHLTEDPAQAEDLLHDAFIEFTITRPDLGSIRHLDNYLYGVLRVLHLSQIRRAARHRLQQLSIVEYDSAEIGLRMADPRDQIKVHEDLRAICHYACIRKETSKAGSILILRFFHGYYPSEIVKIVQASRKVVDIRVLNARREVKLWLDDPTRLSFMKEVPVKLNPEIKPARTSDELLSELRQTIFTSRRGACLPPEELRRIYSETNPAANEGVDQQLGHIVSCATCLDLVNEVLDLPSLADRFPIDMLTQDTSSKRGRKGGPGGGDQGGPEGGGPGGTAGANTLMRRSSQRAREVFEHRPQELHIAVNGFILGSQTVNAEVSEQTLEVNQPDPINFIEVFSEQERRLLLLKIDETPPAGPVEHARRVELSDQRTLELTLRFCSPYPLVHAVYRDPLLKPDSSLAALEMGSAPDVTHNKDTKHAGTVPKVDGPKQDASFVKKLPKIRTQRWRGLFAAKFWLKPGVVTVLFALVLIAAALFIELRRTPPTSPTAASLLSQAEAIEETAASRRDQVLHRTINLEEKNSTGELIAKHTLEVWQSAEREVTARRLYNDQRQLVAGDWRRQDGVQTLYQHGERPQLQLTPEKRSGQSTINVQNVWQLDLAATEFSKFVGNTEDLRFEERPNTYIIAYEAPASRSIANTSVSSVVNGLVRASLILNRADLHSVEQTLVIRQGEEIREFHFVETSFERRLPSTVAPVVFEPEPELLSERTKNDRKESALPSSVTSSPASPLSVTPLPVTASTDLEIDVLRLLSSVGADLGEEVSVHRTAEGQLLVQGVVDTDRRKGEILQALRPVAGNPAVKLNLSTTAEAARRDAEESKGARPITSQQSEPADSKVAAQGEMERYFKSKGLTGEQLNTEMLRFTDRTLSRARQILLRAGALKRLAARFSLEELNTLNPEAREKWLALIHGHAVAIQRENALLRQELETVFRAGGERADANNVSVTDDAGFFRAAERLFDLCAQNDQTISSAFVLSSSRAASTINTPQFWRALNSIEHQAAELARASQNR